MQSYCVQDGKYVQSAVSVEDSDFPPQSDITRINVSDKTWRTEHSSLLMEHAGDYSAHEPRLLYFLS